MYDRNAEKKYDDILDLTRPEPESHPRMPRINRAAQFAPFAALTGFEEIIRETAARAEKEESGDSGGHFE